MVVDAVPEINAWLASMTHDAHFHLTVVAQTIKDPDILATWQKAWENFIQSGQVWHCSLG